MKTHAKNGRPLCPVCRHNQRKPTKSMCGRCERQVVNRTPAPSPTRFKPIAVSGTKGKLCTYRGETYMIYWCGLTRLGTHATLLSPVTGTGKPFWVDTADIIDVRTPPKTPAPATPAARHWLDAEMDRKIADARA